MKKELLRDLYVLSGIEWNHVVVIFGMIYTREIIAELMDILERMPCFKNAEWYRETCSEKKGYRGYCRIVTSGSDRACYPDVSRLGVAAADYSVL